MQNPCIAKWQKISVIKYSNLLTMNIIMYFNFSINLENKSTKFTMLQYSNTTCVLYTM